MAALGPLSVDMYLPAMPAMMEALGASIGEMHLTLSSYLAGFALFHLSELVNLFLFRPDARCIDQVWHTPPR